MILSPDCCLQALEVRARLDRVLAEPAPSPAPLLLGGEAAGVAHPQGISVFISQATTCGISSSAGELLGGPNTQVKLKPFTSFSKIKPWSSLASTFHPREREWVIFWVGDILGG